MRQTGLGWVGVAAVLAAFAGGFAAQWLRPVAVSAGDGIAPQVRARVISVVDERGRERIRLAVDDGRPAVSVCDGESLPRARLTALAHPGDGRSWGLEGLDGEGRRLLQLDSSDDGSASGLAVYDQRGVTRLGFGVTETGSGLALRNAGDQEVLGFGEGGGADYFLKSAGDGREIWRASRAVTGP